MAIVRAGSPSCHRKLFGAANIRWPADFCGCLSTLSVRVWVKSAVQVLSVDWAASQLVRNVFVFAANVEQVIKRKQRQRRVIILARWGRSCTIGRRVGGWRGRRRR